jgi:type II secretory pathway component PulF
MEYKKLLIALSGKKIKHSIYDKLSVQLEYGINLKDSVMELLKRAKRNNNTLMAAILNDVKNKLINGQPFASSIKKWIPAADYTMLASAEKANKLPETLKTIIYLDNMKSGLIKEFLSGMSSPFMLFLAVYALLYYIGKYALKSILGLVSGHNSGSANILIYLSDYVNSPLMYMVPLVLIAVGILIFYSFPRLTGEIRKKLDKFFPFSVYRQFSGSIWLIGLSGLIGAGINEVTALKELASYNNKYMKERLKSFYSNMQNGMNMGESMLASGYDYPDKDVVDDIIVFSNFPNFNKKLDMIAQSNIQKTKNQIKAISIALQALINILLYVVVLLIVIGTLSITQGISNSVNHF